MQGLLLNALEVFFKLIYMLIFVRIFMSWVPGLANSGIGSMVYGLTEPILGPVRNMVNKSPIGGGMMLDFSPIIALFIMNIVKAVLANAVMLFF